MHDSLPDQNHPTQVVAEKKTTFITKTRLISALILLVYCLLLIKVMVFKDVPPLKIGVVTLDFGGTNGENPPNFIPFRTILPYLIGEKGLLIGGLNVIGNIAFLVPIGLLLPFVLKNLGWKKSLTVAIVAGLVIEIMQVILQVGIFDIDDVILNGLGVMVGYWMTMLLMKWVRSERYKTIIFTVSLMTLITAICVTIFVGDILQLSRQSGRTKPADSTDETSGVTIEVGEKPQKKDLCGGTGGNGQIVSVEENSFTLKRHDTGNNQTIQLKDKAKINTSNGAGSITDLKVDDRVTLVGDPEPDGSFTAEAVFVCNSEESSD